MMSNAYSRYVLVALTAVYTLNLVDRVMVMLLLQPIKLDLHVSDTQLGFVTGIAFGLFYSTLGVPIARLADRGNRVTIAAAAIGLWGLTVMSCVLVTNFVQLACARVAAAVGEAGGKAPTYSLIGDYFPRPADRTRAMAVYWLSSPAAGLIGFIGGGALSAHFGWRLTFFLMGIPGLLLAVLVRLTIHEPRMSAAANASKDAGFPTLGEVAVALWRQRSCRHVSIALVLFYTMGLGLAPWQAAFLMRSHGMATAEVGLWFGLIFGLAGIAGVLLGGYVTSRWFTHNERGQMRVTAVMAASLLPCYVAFLTLPERYQALIAFVPLTVVFNFFLAPTYALLQRLVRSDMRATSMAVVMLLANLIGMGLGPQAVGVLSDLLQPTLGTDALRYAMLAMSFIAAWAGYHFWQVGSTVERDLSAVGRPPVLLT